MLPSGTRGRGGRRATRASTTCRRIVIGRHSRRSCWRPGGATLGSSVGRLAPDVDLIEIGGAGARAAPRRAAASRRRRPSAQRASAPAATSSRRPPARCCTALGAAARGRARPRQHRHAVPARRGGVALRYGRGPAVARGVGQVAAFDFFFVPPRFSFAVSDVQYLVTFGVMLAVGADRRPADRGPALPGARRDAPRAALARAVRGRARLSSVLDDRAGRRGRGAARVQREFRARSRVRARCRTTGCSRRRRAPRRGRPRRGHRAMGVRPRPARGPRHRHAAGSAWLYLPLKAPMRTRGVLALRPGTAAAARARAAPPARDLRRADGARARARPLRRGRAAARRCRWSRSACATRCSPRSRTTCARRSRRWSALAETSTMPEPPLSPAQTRARRSDPRRRRMRMSALVNNLLDMARLESGEVRLRPRVAAARGDRRRALRGSRDRSPGASGARPTCRPTCRWSSSTPC